MSEEWEKEFDVWIKSYTRRKFKAWTEEYETAFKAAWDIQQNKIDELRKEMINKYSQNEMKMVLDSLQVAKEALEFYTKLETWKVERVYPITEYSGVYPMDNGNVAKQALKKLNEDINE